MQNQKVPNRVIVAPLNWGWGHATRCIPIIKELINLGIKPVVASDGQALVFLQKEFPEIEFLELPSYNIRYGKQFKWSMFLNIPAILRGVYKEHQAIKVYIKAHKNSLLGMISDNRLGVFSKHLPSVYITHQLSVKAGVGSFFVNKFHHYFIKKHKECWVPDEENSLLSGALSRSLKIKIHYIGVLSRFKKQEIPVAYELLILLSGIEYQRNELELKINKALLTYKKPVLVVRGTFEPCKYMYPKNCTVVNYLLSKDLETALNSSRRVVSRSGYSSVMDLATLNKEVLFVPTPGQTEQEYLASYLKESGLASFCTQKEFDVEFLQYKKTAQWPVLTSNEQSLSLCIKTFFNLSLV
ncbi:UDP:flavonoid glycosyltransferase YjiC (YdhE family) [Wenyingzhuangia heitensis]|uniref:UDP:flavonoid glycosyltransferase YjiC (YdhE family) n=1 Tax=Wenyingzhuangia heitensis TaxID=1487859 RepID=A0ABX0U8U9_9FLAO|nr:UDP-N-acetylglucosamine--N-acetylmuramyl-(pentapeptide) pyrophosphoryl-undecaprenol N-acetylglucosamine transferase [Wenyingzhuangia heitensis]NIJ43931.1 UDP:flavonoid glycosyltransferase YjiC (YdhE family) [Wenyingzhuangia heitensis]